jgi:hypothetical protein
MSSLATENISPDGVMPVSSEDLDTVQWRPVTSHVRVTHIVWNFDGGGLESVVASLAKQFRGTSVRSSVISLSGRIGRLGVERCVDFEHVLAIRPWPGVSMIAPIGLAKLIRRTKADVVHLHSGVWFKGALAARMAGSITTPYRQEFWMPQRLSSPTLLSPSLFGSSRICTDACTFRRLDYGPFRMASIRVHFQLPIDVNACEVTSESRTVRLLSEVLAGCVGSSGSII